jgi:hypothetical protein
MRKAANDIAKPQATKIIFSVEQNWRNSPTEVDSQEGIRCSRPLH